MDLQAGSAKIKTWNALVRRLEVTLRVEINSSLVQLTHNAKDGLSAVDNLKKRQGQNCRKSFEVQNMHNFTVYYECPLH